VPLKGAKKKYYNKKYYAENKEKITEKSRQISRKGREEPFYQCST